MRRIFWLVLLAVTALFAACNSDKKLREYGYVFQESTGDNQFILMDGRKVTVKNFLADASNEIALKSLQALKWDVLYTNSEGDKIFLRGEYDHQSQSFRLNHWYIKAPFQKLVIEDESYVPHKMHEITKQSLERTDFETKDGFNPNDPPSIRGHFSKLGNAIIYAPAVADRVGTSRNTHMKLQHYGHRFF